MVGSNGEVTTDFTPTRGEEGPVVGEDRTARRLAREFGAPVGILDPLTLVWRSRLGVAAESFPGLDASLSAILASGLLRHGRVEVWRPDPDAGPAWLCLPIARRDGPNLVALVGFSTGVEVDPGWGPPCPERALRAWGQLVADGLRVEVLPRSGGSRSPFRGEGGNGS